MTQGSSSRVSHVSIQVGNLTLIIRVRTSTENTGLLAILMEVSEDVRPHKKNSEYNLACKRRGNEWTDDSNDGRIGLNYSIRTYTQRKRGG